MERISQHDSEDIEDDNDKDSSNTSFEKISDGDSSQIQWKIVDQKKKITKLKQQVQVDDDDFIQEEEVISKKPKRSNQPN